MSQTPSSTFTFDQAVELAVVDRGGFIESRHAGAAVVVDPTGAEVLILGATDAPVLTRSCLKPLQAVAVLESGVQLTGPQAALATASHRAQARHVHTVETMLADAGLDEQALQCPVVSPADREYGRKVTQERPESALYFNCSGKHAAFLAAQVHAGEPVEEYLEPESFIQRAVVDTVTQYCEEQPAFTTVDGCGAPVHALTLTALARGIGKVTAARSGSAYTLVQSVMDNPWAIEGTGRPNSVVVEKLGVFAKFGAEGVLVMGTRDGYSVAVKTLDGSQRANSFVALQLLAHVGAVDARAALPVMVAVTPEVTGGINQDGKGRVVGAIKAGTGLLEGLT